MTKIRLPMDRWSIYAVSIGAAVVVSSVYLPLSLPSAAKRPLALRSKIALRSLSIFSFTITHWKCRICKRREYRISFRLKLYGSHSTYLRWVNTNWCVCAVCLLTLDALNVNDEFFSVDLDDLADGVALVMTTHYLRFGTREKLLSGCVKQLSKMTFFFCWTYLNFVVFANWHATHIVLLLQFFRQWCWHQLPTNVWWGRKMTFTIFAPVGGNVLVEFHFRLTSVARCLPQKQKSKMTKKMGKNGEEENTTKIELNFGRSLFWFRRKNHDLLIRMSAI